jgi:hypothetical protein
VYSNEEDFYLDDTKNQLMVFSVYDNVGSNAKIQYYKETGKQRSGLCVLTSHLVIEEKGIATP